MKLLQMGMLNSGSSRFPEYDYGTVIPNQAGIFFDFNAPVYTNETSLLIQFPVGAREPQDFIDFSVFPNPTSTTLTVVVSADDASRVDAYEIIDQLGQRVYASKGIERNTINVVGLVPGLYTLVLKEEGAVIGMRKFVRE